MIFPDLSDSTTPAASLARWQERGLREQALAQQDCSTLAYYYAARHDLVQLQALLTEMADFAPRGLLAARLYLGDLPDAPAAQGEVFHDPGLACAAVKAMMRGGRMRDALEVVRIALEAGAAGLPVLNLAAKALHAQGMLPTARELAAISLSIAPCQDDMTALCEDTGVRPWPARGLYLEPLPKPGSIACYIPAYQVESYMRGAIEGLLAQSHPLDEIIVVDDGCTDGSMTVAGGYPVRIVSHWENRGLAAARNTAFKESAAKYLAAIDTDAVPSPRYLEMAWLELENAPDHVAGVGGRLLEEHVQSPADRFRLLHMNQDLGPLRICSPEYLFGANTVYCRQRVLDAGAYDEAMRTNAEDHDLGRKLRAAGLEVIHTPLLEARHMRRDTPQSVLRTLWGWSFHEKRQRGLFESWDSIAAMNRANIAEARRLMEADWQSGHADVVYLDFLFLFHDSLHNLGHATRNGILSRADACALRHGLLDSVRELDARWGGMLHPKMLKDSADLLDGPGAGLSPPLAEWLQLMRVELNAFFEGISREVYEAIAGAPEKGE